MAKKEKLPSTPESRAKKLEDKQEVRKTFKKTFFPALAVCLSLLLIYSVCYIALIQPNQIATASSGGTASSASSGGAAASSSGSSAAAPAASVETPAAGTVTELTDSSSLGEAVSYFNDVMNKVKPEAKSITLNKETNSEAGGISGNLPGTLTGIANSLIASNMGDKDLSALPAEEVNATTADAKNKMFPVENETWSSHLTADDVERHEVKVTDSSYEITLYIKADDPSESTAHDVGHAGKIFSVVMPSIVNDNAGPAASLIKNVATGHKDGYVKVSVDKATGHVLTADYHYVWTLELTALGTSLSIPFGLDKSYTINW